MLLVFAFVVGTHRGQLAAVGPSQPPASAEASDGGIRSNSGGGGGGGGGVFAAPSLGGPLVMLGYRRPPLVGPDGPVLQV
jgi:hypothetical protein